MYSLQRSPARGFSLPPLCRACALLAVVCVASAVATSAAAEYPDRPIRLIVASAPGGGPDTSSRLIAAELVKQIRQQVVVDNRPGASGSIGTELIARAAPDGYTIGQGNFSTLGTNRTILPRLPYDPDKDLQMVVHMYMTPNLLAVAPQLPVNSVQELIDHARRNPGQLMFASSGNGTSMHFGGELFKQLTGVDMVHVPYKAAQQGVTDLIGGQVQLMFDNVTSIGVHVKAGRVRGLAVTAPKRVPAYPELPTVAESGVPGYEITPWGGIIVPAGVPKVIIARLNAEVNKALMSPTIREKFAALGNEIVGGTPEQFAAHVKKEVAKWADVAKRAGVKAE